MPDSNSAFKSTQQNAKGSSLTVNLEDIEKDAKRKRKEAREAKEKATVAAAAAAAAALVQEAEAARVAAEEEQKRIAEKSLAKAAKNAAAAHRREILPAVVNAILANEISIAQAAKKHKIHYEVLSRNVESMRLKKELAKKGPVAIFTEAEQAQVRDQQVQNALSKNAVTDRTMPARMQEDRIAVAEARAALRGEAPDSVPGAAKEPLKKTSYYKYREMYGRPRAGDTQTPARAEAVGCLYNAISFVVAVREMYGFYYGDNLEGEYAHKNYPCLCSCTMFVSSLCAQASPSPTTYWTPKRPAA